MKSTSIAVAAFFALLLAAPQFIGTAHAHEGGDREQSDPFAKERKQNLVDEFKIEIDGKKVDYIAVRTPDEGHVILVPKRVKRVRKGGGFLTGLLVPVDDRRAGVVADWVTRFGACMAMLYMTDVIANPDASVLPSPVRQLVSTMIHAWFASIAVGGITGSPRAMLIGRSEELGKARWQPNPDQVQAACSNAPPPPEKVELVRNPKLMVKNEQLFLKEGGAAAPVKRVYIFENDKLVAVEIGGVRRPATEEDKKAFNHAFEKWGEQLRQGLAKFLGGDGGAASSGHPAVHASYRPGVAVRLKDGYGLVLGAKINF